MRVDAVVRLPPSASAALRGPPLDNPRDGRFEHNYIVDRVQDQVYTYVPRRSYIGRTVIDA